MKRFAASLLTVAGAIIVLGACSSSSFTGSSAKVAADSATGTSTATPACLADGPNSLGLCGASTTTTTNSGTATATNTATSPTGTSTGGSPSACVQGSKVNFQWSGPEETCIVQQHMTYDFDTNQCAQMRPSQFTCDWPTLLTQLNQRGLLDKTPCTAGEQPDCHPYYASQQGDLLVSCGESQDGSRIAVQYVSESSVSSSCSYSPQSHHITTGCYTQYSGTPPPPPTTQAEEEAQVYSCLNQL